MDRESFCEKGIKECSKFNYMLVVCNGLCVLSNAIVDCPPPEENLVRENVCELPERM